MNTECFSTANSITEVLLAGDAILNLSRQPLNTVPGTQFIHADSRRVLCSPLSASVVWRDEYLSPLADLAVGKISRVVVVSEDGSQDAEPVVRELTARRISHLHCTLVTPCDADAFMDEEDTEAVTERLRQLGYI